MPDPVIKMFKRGVKVKDIALTVGISEREVNEKIKVFKNKKKTPKPIPKPEPVVEKKEEEEVKDIPLFSNDEISGFRDDDEP